MGKILIIDDEPQLRNLLARIIGLEGYEVATAENCVAGWQRISEFKPEVVLCDVKLPDGNGVDFVEKIKHQYPHIEIILLTAYGNIPDGVQAIKNGAFDYITKGDDNNKIIPLLFRAMEKAKGKSSSCVSDKKDKNDTSFDSILGNSDSLKTVIDLARKVAATDTSVLLTGETGTGKEVFAQAIHHAGPRKKEPFIAINCSAFTKDLLESELFGHKAGSFTGATKDKKGLFEEANHGTLFLDEIGEMPVELQAKLLRVLECGEFIMIGDSHTHKVDVRIIAATNRELDKEISSGNFREDLYFRLSVFCIALPPLRERKEDIPVYIDYFVSHFAHKMGKNIEYIEPEYMTAMKNHKWAGNVRELRNTVERSLILTDDNRLSVTSLSPAFKDEAPNDGDSMLLNELERRHILKVLEYTQGNKSEAARLLGIGIATLYRKLEIYGIKK